MNSIRINYNDQYEFQILLYIPITTDKQPAILPTELAMQPAAIAPATIPQTAAHVAPTSTTHNGIHANHPGPDPIHPYAQNDKTPDIHVPHAPEEAGDHFFQQHQKLFKPPLIH